MMKKKILGLALIAMSLVAFTGAARTTTDTNTSAKEAKENVKGKKADRKECHAKVNPFEGLDLTDAQQAKIQQLDNKRKTERKEQMQARKENKQRQSADRKEARRNAKKEYLKEVKEIIGSDKYVTFLENAYVNNGRHGDGKAFRQGKHNGKKGMARGKNVKSGRRS